MKNKLQNLLRKYRENELTYENAKEVHSYLEELLNNYKNLSKEEINFLHFDRKFYTMKVSLKQRKEIVLWKHG